MTLDRIARLVALVLTVGGLGVGAVLWKAEADEAHAQGREAYKGYQAQAQLEEQRRKSGLAQAEAIIQLCNAGKLPDDSDECRLARLKADRLRERR